MTEPAPGDTAPPAIVTNLEASGATASSITLSWAAPGDDGSIDTASEYDIRYSGSEITQATWDSATQCTGKPAPQAAGSSENFIVTGLYPDTTYYFALKTADEVLNWSGLSNVLNGTTSLRTIPLTKTVKAVHEAPIEPSYASMGISCDLIGVDENGEDIYVISEVYCLSQYFLGYYEVSIGSSSGIIWENRSVTIPPPLNPHGSPLDFGTLYLPSRELKEGIRVYPSDWISVQACGVTERELFSIIKVILYGQVGGAPLFYESAESYLAADYIDTSEFPPIVVGDMEEPPQAFGQLCSPLSPSDSYSYEVRGLDTATYDLGLISVKADESVAFLATNIPTAPGTVHQYTIAWDALSEDKNGVTVQVDSDGDGVFERTITEDNELTGDEFILQTATTIDFDPDTLNLKGKGQYVTVYIELPPDYDVGQIDVSSIMLNEVVPALTKPTEVGDYDNDGVPDIMVKFDRAAVQDILTIGDQVEITISGEVTGITFAGSDIIKVIDD